MKIHKAQTPGQRLRALREAFDVSQQFIADLCKTARPHIVRVEGDAASWDAKKLLKRLMAAFGMTYEQLNAYVSGEMPIEEAIRIASPKIRAAMEREGQRKANEKVLDAVWKKALVKRALSESTRAVAYDLFELIGWDLPQDRMVKQVLDLDKSLTSYIEQYAKVSGSQRTVLK